MSATVEQGERQRVLIWRLRAFQELGCSTVDALALAGSDADLHLAQEMVERGCDPELLVAILT